MLEQFFEHIVEDLRVAQLEGVKLQDGRQFWLSPIGIKGDWPFLAAWLETCTVEWFTINIPFLQDPHSQNFLRAEATAGRLTRTFRQGPKAASAEKAGTGVCHYCLAGTPGYDFEDMSRSSTSVQQTFRMGLFSRNPKYAP